MLPESEGQVLALLQRARSVLWFWVSERAYNLVCVCTCVNICAHVCAFICVSIVLACVNVVCLCVHVCGDVCLCVCMYCV